MQNASMHEAHFARNSHVTETFSSRDTRSVPELFSGHLLAPFHFDVFHVKKAATATNHAEALSVPHNRAFRQIRPRLFTRHNNQLTILLSKRCVNPRPRCKPSLPVENLRGAL